jgi:hypothetical protein
MSGTKLLPRYENAYRQEQSEIERMVEINKGVTHYHPKVLVAYMGNIVRQWQNNLWSSF